MKLKSTIFAAIALTTFTGSFAQIQLGYGVPSFVRTSLGPISLPKPITAQQQKIKDDSLAFLAAKRKYCSDNVRSPGALCTSYIDNYQLNKNVEQQLLSAYPSAYTTTASYDTWKALNRIN